MLFLLPHAIPRGLKKKEQKTTEAMYIQNYNRNSKCYKWLLGVQRMAELIWETLMVLLAF